jgi:U3 small nucleolar RNA-associated protein 21
MESPLGLKRKRSTAVEDLREYYESISESADSEAMAANETTETKGRAGDVIFKPYRAIGLVCDELGFVYHRNVQEKQLTASIGHAFLTYSGDKLRIIYASPHIDRKISCLAIYKDYVFTACGSEIHMWAKVHKVASQPTFP